MNISCYELLFDQCEKFKIKKIDDQNYENLFYNRSNLDELIIALKEDIDLENLGCAI